MQATDMRHVWILHFLTSQALWDWLQLLAVGLLQTKLIYGTLMILGIISPIAYFSANIKNYRGEK